MDDVLIEAWVESAESIADAWDDEGTEAALRAIVAPQYRYLPYEQLAALVDTQIEAMPPALAEDFLGGLKSLGKQLAPAAASLLPVAGQVAGMAFGGPAGAAIGGAAGQFGGKLLSGAAGGGRPRSRVGRIAAGVAGAAGAALGAPPGGGAPGGAATGQLLSLLQNPALLQSVLGQLLGPAGQSAVPLGTNGSSAGFPAIMNALGTVAGEAAGEAIHHDSIDGVPAYLQDAEGGLRCDPAVPEERAAVLVEQLRSASTGVSYSTRSRDPVAAWLVGAGAAEAHE